MTDVKIDDNFIQKYQAFIAKFDEALKDPMNGEECDSMAKSFLSEFGSYLEQFEPCVKIVDASGADTTKYLTSKGSNIIDLCMEDLKILEQDPSVELSTPNYAPYVAGTYWRAAAGLYLNMTLKLAKTKKDDGERKDTMDLARRAFRMTPHDFDTAYWFMITVGYTCEKWSNSKERAAMGTMFRASADHCIKLKPDHYLAHHLLGRYYLTIASLSWVEKQITKGFTNVKVDVGFEDAEREFLKADELRPNWLQTGLCMARVLVSQKRSIDEIKHWIDYGLNQDCVEPISVIEREELLALKAKLKLDK